jgi:hypothetical protein
LSVKRQKIRFLQPLLIRIFLLLLENIDAILTVEFSEEPH